jgi:predicted amidohydrolase YtcJ
VVDLGDATLMPGFVDAHVHLSATGLADHGADLRAARSVAEVLDRVRAAAARTADGLLWGDGYDETRFDRPELPSPAELAEAAGGRPVYLSRVDGHQGLATLDVLGDSGALAAAGCDRDPAGAPTGVTRGEANHLARRFALGHLPAATLLAAQDAALAQAARRGVACVHEMGGPTSPAGATSSCSWTGSRPCPSRSSATGATWTWTTPPTASWPRSAGTCSWTGRSAPTPPPSPPPTRTGPTPAGAVPHRRGADRAVRAGQPGRDPGRRPRHRRRGHRPGPALRPPGHEGRRADRLPGLPAPVEHVELLGADGADRMAELGLAASVQPAFDAAWGGPDGMYARRLGPAGPRA